MYFVAQPHTPNDHCVRFAVVVTFPDATLVTKLASRSVEQLGADMASETIF